MEVYGGRSYEELDEDQREWVAAEAERRLRTRP
jgi:hypothetical protein